MKCRVIAQISPSFLKAGDTSTAGEQVMSVKELGDIDWPDDRLREFALYWDSLRSEGELPKQSDFDPSAVTHLLPGVAIYELRDDGQMYCRLMGTGLAEQFGWDYTHSDFFNFWPEEGKQQIHGMLVNLLENCRGLCTQLAATTQSGFEITADTVCLPALDNDGQPNRLITLAITEKVKRQIDPREDKVVSVEVRRICQIGFSG